MRFFFKACVAAASIVFGAACSTSTGTTGDAALDGCSHPSGAEICRSMGGTCGPLAFFSGQRGSCPAGTKEYSGGLTYSCWEACVTEGDRILCCVPDPDASTGDAASDAPSDATDSGADG